MNTNKSYTSPAYTTNFIHHLRELKINGWVETPESVKEAFDIPLHQFRAWESLALSDERYGVDSKENKVRSNLGMMEYLLNYHKTIYIWPGECTNTEEFAKHVEDVRILTGANTPVLSWTWFGEDRTRIQLHQTCWLLELMGYEVRYPTSDNAFVIICTPEK